MAAKFISNFAGQDIHTVAVDSSWDSVLSYAATHDAAVVDAFTHHMQFESMPAPHVVYHADVSDDSLHGLPKWLPSIASWAPDVAVISSPCQPWSNAGSGSGLLSEEGTLLPQALKLIRLLKPRLLGLEQVAGFPGHQHFNLVMTQLRAIGYQCLWQGTVESSQFGCAQRNRWLCLAGLQSAPELSSQIIQPFLRHHASTPLTMQTVLNWTPEQIQQLQPDDQVLQLASRHDLLPGYAQTKVSSDHQAVLKSRCNPGTSQVKTCMAQYGNQHNLSISTLKDKGLLVHFAQLDQENGTIRYWHPLEVQLHHVCHSKIFAAASVQQGWLHAGNLISCPHAIFILVNGFNMLAFPSKINLAEIMKSLWEQRLSTSNGSLFVADFGTFFHHQDFPLNPNIIENLRELFRIQPPHLASDFIWHPTQGIQRFPPLSTNTPSGEAQSDAVLHPQQGGPIEAPQSSEITVPAVSLAAAEPYASATTPHQDEVATQDFCVFQTGKIHSAVDNFVFLVAMDVTFAALQTFWDDTFSATMVEINEATLEGCSVKIQDGSQKRRSCQWCGPQTIGSCHLRATLPSQPSRRLRLCEIDLTMGPGSAFC